MTKRLWRAILACVLTLVLTAGGFAASGLAGAHSTCRHNGHFHTYWVESESDGQWVSSRASRRQVRHRAALTLHTLGDGGWSVHGHLHLVPMRPAACSHVHPRLYFW